MPSNKYNLLSDREREFLENPDNFDSQTAAEIRYRIRTKWEEVEEAYNVLGESFEKWAKEEVMGGVLFDCKRCNNTEISDITDLSQKPDSWHFNYKDHREVHIPEGWWVGDSIDLSSLPQEVSCPECDTAMFIDTNKEEFYCPICEEQNEILGRLYSQYDNIHKQNAHCPDCYDGEEIKKEAKETGLVPCVKDYCNTHRITSNQFEDHREYIPLSDMTIEEIKEEGDY